MQGATLPLLASLVELQESDPELYANLQAAEQRYEHAENPFEVVSNTLDYLLALQRWDVIQPWAERAYQLDPQHWLPLYTLGFFHGACGRPDLSVPLFERLEQRYPENPVHLCLLIEACMANLEFDRAKQLIMRALEEAGRPDRFSADDPTRFEYFRRLCILQGRLELSEGQWSGFATQLLTFKQLPMAHTLPDVKLWDGEALAGQHLCITRLGGFGDVLLFMALVQKIVQYAKHVSILVQPVLHELLQASLPNCTVLPYDNAVQCAPDQATIAPFLAMNPPDLQISSVYLPALAKQLLTERELRFEPYLRVPERATQSMQSTMAAIRSRAAGQPVIGIAWDRSQYNQPHVDGHQALLKKFSSLPVTELLHILQHPLVAERCHFVALHEEETPRAWPDPMPENLSRIGLLSTTFSDTAAVIDACDFILSIDMSIANLAAMLGKPTWLMLWHEGEWRFGHRGQSSPWLSNVRCFRQATPGDWRSMSNAVIAALTAYSAPVIKQSSGT
jgi:hypothetical protein